MCFLFLFRVSWGKASDHRQGRSFPEGLGLDIAGGAAPTQTSGWQVILPPVPGDVLEMDRLKQGSLGAVCPGMLLSGHPAAEPTALAV